MKPRHKFNLKDSSLPHLLHQIVTQCISAASLSASTLASLQPITMQVLNFKLFHPWLLLHPCYFRSLNLPTLWPPLHHQWPGPRRKTSLILILNCFSTSVETHTTYVFYQGQSSKNFSIHIIKTLSLLFCLSVSLSRLNYSHSLPPHIILAQCV